LLMERKVDLEVIRAACDQAGRPTRVVALNQQLLDPPAEMVLLSLEEWTKSFTVHWFFATPDPSGAIDLRLQDGLEWDLVDDRANHYRGGDYGGGGGNSPNWRRASYFAPALDAEATRLTVRVASPVNGQTIETVIQLDR
jgi:hypothetical protein